MSFARMAKYRFLDLKVIAKIIPEKLKKSYE
jgi:hypothetical protein